MPITAYKIAKMKQMVFLIYYQIPKMVKYISGSGHKRGVARDLRTQWKISLRQVSMIPNTAMKYPFQLSQNNQGLIREGGGWRMHSNPLCI